MGPGGLDVRLHFEEGILWLGVCHLIYRHGMIKEAQERRG